MRGWHWRVWAGVAALLGVLLIVDRAAGHDWYPWDCCSGLDCAPVTEARQVPEIGLVVTSKHGTTVVPASFPRRDSQDSRMHVCMRKGEAGMVPICLFVPPVT